MSNKKVRENKDTGKRETEAGKYIINWRDMKIRSMGALIVVKYTAPTGW